MGMVYSVQQKRGEGCSTGAGGFSQRVHLTYTTTPLNVQGKKIPCLQKQNIPAA